MSEDGSNSSYYVPLLENIGAQDILRVGPSFNGILRKRGHNNNPLNKIGIGSTKWKTRFVVILKGCVYCFKDEYAHKPQCAFSLSSYDSVEEAMVPGVLNSFEIKHNTDESQSPHMFACESNSKRQTWIEHFQEAMQHAHQQSWANLSSADNKSTNSKDRRPPKMSLPPTPGNPSNGKQYADAPPIPLRHQPSQSSLASNDTEAIDTTPKTNISNGTKDKRNVPKPVIQPPVVRQPSISERPPLPLPSTERLVGSRNGISNGTGPRPLPNKGRPGMSSNSVSKDNNSDSLCDDEGAVASTNCNVHELFNKAEYFYNSRDKTEAQRLLENKPIGTFLVRLGNSTPTVLSVQTSVGLASVKEFQIVEQEGRLSINKTDYFPSRDDLLNYYSTNVLPRKDYAVMLIKGYKAK